MLSFPPSSAPAPTGARPSRTRALTALVLSAAAILPAALSAQATDALAAARSLRDAGRYAEGADSVRSWLSRNPDDPRVRWLLAQLLHWSGDPGAARLEYETAVRELPGDPWLRLDQVRALLDLRRFDGAEAVLEVTLAMREADAAAIDSALTLLGTAAYWSGDLPEAIERYQTALARNPENREARERLDEILRSTRSWARAGARMWRDNQPLRRYEGTIEVGRHLDPLWTLSLEGSTSRIQAGTGTGAAEGRAGVSGYVPDARLEIAGGFGLAGGSVASGGRTTWTGEGRLAVRTGPGSRLGVRAWRERYLWTASSTDTLLAVRGIEATFDASRAPAWAGEAVARRETLPDGNAIRTAYGWVLAPLSSRLRAGYSVSWQDSDESRWIPGDSVPTTGGGPGRGPGGPPFPGVVSSGAYVPYFTPEATHVHSLLGEVTVPVGPGTLRLDLSWGVDAVEEVPVRVSSGAPVPGAEPRIAFTERSFRPWTGRGSLVLPTGSNGDVRIEAERSRTAFYQATRLSLVWTRRLGTAGIPDP